MQSEKFIVNWTQEPEEPVMFKRISALLLVVVLVVLTVAAYYLRDPNQFKQDLQDLAAEQSGRRQNVDVALRVSNNDAAQLACERGHRCTW